MGSPDGGCRRQPEGSLEPAAVRRIGRSGFETLQRPSETTQPATDETFLVHSLRDFGARRIGAWESKSTSQPLTGGADTSTSTIDPDAGHRSPGPSSNIRKT